MCLLQLACSFLEPKQQNLKHIPYTKISSWQKIWVRRHATEFWFCSIFRESLYKDRGELWVREAVICGHLCLCVGSGLFQWQRGVSLLRGVCRWNVSTDFIWSYRQNKVKVGGAQEATRDTFGKCCSFSVGLFLEEDGLSQATTLHP